VGERGEKRNGVPSRSPHEQKKHHAKPKKPADAATACGVLWGMGREVLLGEKDSK